MDEHLAELRRTSIEKIKSLVLAIKHMEEPAPPPQPSAIKGMLNDIQSFIDRQPLESAASAVILGALAERALESVGMLGMQQVESVKCEIQRIIRRTFERTLADALEQGLTLVAIPLTKFLAQKSASASSEFQENSAPKSQDAPDADFETIIPSAETEQVEMHVAH